MTMATDVLKTIWPEWEIEQQLGRGSYGVVYKAVRREYNMENRAAIKVISIPSDASELESLRSEGLDMNATRTYLQSIVNDFVGEIQLMESLKGIQNIVSVEDYKVVEKKDELGWDICIRMELLTPFNSYSAGKKFTEAEVIKLGCDICNALEICGKRSIIHRDIKPENIFVNDFGYFKLGDFGIARKLENMTGSLSQKGTFFYMAPEVANSRHYDARVDIYSLGLVLYRLLNGNRFPFLDTEEQISNPNERRRSVDRRIRGEPLPPPQDASPAMADIILRACAFDPNRRFASAAEMREALIRAGNGTYRTQTGGYDRTVSIRSVQPGPGQGAAAGGNTPQAAGRPVDTFTRRPKGSLGLKILAALLIVAIILCVWKIAASGFLNGSIIRIGGAAEDNSAEAVSSPAPEEGQTDDLVLETERPAETPEQIAGQEQSTDAESGHEPAPLPNVQPSAKVPAGNPALFLGSAREDTTDIVMTIADVNIRTGPGTEYEKIVMVDPGTVFTCYGTDSGWFIIDYQGAKRYVTGKYARYVRQEDMDDGVIGTLVTTTEVNVRTGPDTSYDVVTTLTKGRKLVYTGMTGGWYQVIYYDGSTAFIIDDYVDVSR